MKGKANDPPPQTVAGSLDQVGLIGPLSPLPGLKTDLSWLFMRPRYVGRYTINKSNTAGSTIAVIRPFSLRQNVESIAVAHWHELLLSLGRYWNGAIVWRFYMVKPERVVGRLLVEYRPEAFLAAATWGTNVGESQQRHIVKEWDLSKSDFIDLRFNGYNPIEMRPTKVARMIQTGTAATRNQRLAHRLPISQHFAGSMRLSVAQPIQPGSIFPDQYDIIAEIFLQDVTVAERSDCRYATTPNTSLMTFALTDDSMTQ